MLMVVDKTETEVYQYKKLIFILYKNQIIIRTSLNQTFYLVSNFYWTPTFFFKRMSIIRYMIGLGEIRSLNELASYTRPGIKWESTIVDYDIRNCDIRNLE